MVADSWFRSLWKTSGKHDHHSEKGAIGVLSFEVTNLMSKLVHAWKSLSDKQILKLREEIATSMGIRKLVSEDEDYIVRLIYSEMFVNIVHVAKMVARLCNKCTNPSLRGFENALDEFITKGTDPHGWHFTWKKMDKKVKKMERFISANASLYHEMEVLSELEQTFRRMKASDEPDTASLLEFQKKVAWKKQEVKNLQEMSLWNRTYDYTIILLIRCLFSAFNRIQHVFGVFELGDGGNTDNLGVSELDNMYRSHSLSTLLQSSDHPSENRRPRFASGPLGGPTHNSGVILRSSKANGLYSGPIGGGSTTKSGPLFMKNKKLSFYSGPLGRFFTNKSSKTGKNHGHAASIDGIKVMKSNRLTQVGPFRGFTVTNDGFSVNNCHDMSNNVHLRMKNSGMESNKDLVSTGSGSHSSQSIFTLSRKLLNAPLDTLGAAALALHYANVIIVIEKLASSPHLIGLDAREDLYNMLPTSVRASLRAKLKPYAKSLGSALYDTVLAGEWTEAMSKILEWLAPLAHNMIRWQSERSFEQQNVVSRTNVLLVQTLHFANQEKTEALITELLVGLNYVWRCGREMNAKALAECASS